MKIRNGFVSNSSSSSYIVSVPKGFVVTKNMISEEAMDELWENEILDDEGKINKKALKLINAAFNTLKSGKIVYSNDFGGCDVFWTVQCVLEDQNMIVMSVPGAGGDGEDAIMPFKDERKTK